MDFAYQRKYNVEVDIRQLAHAYGFYTLSFFADSARYENSEFIFEYARRKWGYEVHIWHR